MKIHVFITTFKRQAMLNKVVKHLKSYNVDVFIIPDEIGGKRNFYKVWTNVLKVAELNPCDLYIFMPDDFQNLDVDRIISIHKQHYTTPYACNIINDGRLKCWTRVRPLQWNDELIRVGFVDCGFFCNTETMRWLGNEIPQPPNEWWVMGEHISSGVGKYLSERLYLNRVRVFLPYVSLAEHGNHESKMHTELRKIQPLISK